MKNNITIICALLIFTLVSCANEAPVKDFVILTGKVINVKEGIRISGGKLRNHNLNIQEDGTFIDTLRIDEGMYTLTSDRRNRIQLYLNPGKNLNVEFDANNFNETLLFSGEGKVENDYLFDKQELVSKETKGGNMYLMEEVEFKTKQNQLKDAKLKLLENTQGLAGTFKNNEIKNIRYEYLEPLSNYERYHAYYSENKDFKVSEGFLDEMTDIDYQNTEDYFFSKAYQNLLQFHYRNKSQENSEEQPYDLAYLSTLAKIKNEVVRNELLYKEARSGITYTNDLGVYYKTFSDAVTNVSYKEEVDKTYQKLQTLAEGKPSPTFNNYENYKGGTTSLKDLRGKYVYIDVWATWCGPCIKEIPFLKKIEKDYHNENIEFVSISVDKQSDRDKWRTMVDKEELEGVQLLADNDFKSDFVQDYLINGIPRFILLDTEGNIIKSNAPRPSNPELTKLFDDLLNKG